MGTMRRPTRTITLLLLVAFLVPLAGRASPSSGAVHEGPAPHAAPTAGFVAGAAGPASVAPTDAPAENCCAPMQGCAASCSATSSCSVTPVLPRRTSGPGLDLVGPFVAADGAFPPAGPFVDGSVPPPRG